MRTLTIPLHMCDLYNNIASFQLEGGEGGIAVAGLLKSESRLVVGDRLVEVEVRFWLLFL